MAEASQKANTSPALLKSAPASPVKTVRDGLSELESIIWEARHLAVAARMMGTSNTMPTEEGAALDTVASGIINRMEHVEAERFRLWQALREPSDDE